MFLCAPDWYRMENIFFSLKFATPVSGFVDMVYILTNHMEKIICLFGITFCNHLALQEHPY